MNPIYRLNTFRFKREKDILLSGRKETPVKTIQPAISLEGYLHKKGYKGPIKTWKRRYFFLEKIQNLFYFENEANKIAAVRIGSLDAEAIGCIGLSQLNASVKVYGVSSQTNGYSSSGILSASVSSTETCVFTVEIPGRIYFLEAANANEMNVWINGLNRVLEKN